MSINVEFGMFAIDDDQKWRAAEPKSEILCADLNGRSSAHIIIIIQNQNEIKW